MLVKFDTKYVDILVKTSTNIFLPMFYCSWSPAEADNVKWRQLAI